MKQFRDIGNPRKILAIRFMRLGDIVLLLPALGRLKAIYPESHLTLLTDERCAPIAEMCPCVDEVIPVHRLEMRDGPVLQALQAIGRVVHDIRRRHFDFVIDFLSFRETNLLAWLSGAPNRLGMKRYDKAYLSYCFNLPPVSEDKAVHVSDMFQLIVNSCADGRDVPVQSSPALVVPDSAQVWAVEAARYPSLVSFFVGAPVKVRRWPAEYFARVADFIVQQFGASIAVLAGPHETEIAEKVRSLCKTPGQVSVFSNLSLPQLTALIARSRLLLSNDTGPMHLGPALGVPTLGLFSVGYPEHFRPLGSRSRFLRAEPIEEISPETVMQQIGSMWDR